MQNKESMEKRIAEMTLEQKLGRLVCARAFIWHEDEVDDVVELIKKRALGGVQIVYGKRPSPEVNEKILNAAKEANYPLLVMADMERGYPETKLPLVPMCCLSACGKKEYYHAFAKALSKEAKEAGFNGNWGPVVDILGGNNPLNITRKFSDDPIKVAEAAEEISKIFKQNHFFSTAKHFPGGKAQKGAENKAPVDSHLMENSSMATIDDILDFSTVPYKKLLEKGYMDCVMSTHTVYKNIDPEYPATLSKKVIDILRKDIGFDGVIFTDSLSMSGIRQKYDMEFTVGRAIAAGHDMLLPCFNTPTKEVIELLKKNYENGVITDERLNEAVRHVLTLQDFVAAEPENPAIFTEEDEMLLNNIAKDCVTAITDEGVSPSLDNTNSKKLFVIIEEEKRMDEESGEISISPWYDSKRVGEVIKKHFPDSELLFLPPLSIPTDHQKALTLTRESDEVILVTQCYCTAYLGTDSLTRRSEAILNALIYTGKVSALLHFGSPYAIKPLFHIPRKIFGYIMPESQDYAVEILAGKAEAKGTMPFSVEFQ